MFSADDQIVPVCFIHSFNLLPFPDGNLLLYPVSGPHRSSSLVRCFVSLRSAYAFHLHSVHRVLGSAPSPSLFTFSIWTHPLHYVLTLGAVLVLSLVPSQTRFPLKKDVE